MLISLFAIKLIIFILCTLTSSLTRHNIPHGQKLGVQGADNINTFGEKFIRYCGCLSKNSLLTNCEL